MGKIADAIEEIEEELAHALNDVARLEKENGNLLEQAEEDEKLIEQYDALLDYLEENYPGVVTAFEVANRMEK